MFNSELSQKLRPFLWVLPIFIVSLVFIADPRYFSSSPLRSDDWNWIIEPIIFNPLKIINLSDRRPLLSSLLAVLTPLFGLNIHWYYITNWFLLFLSGVVCYLIVKNAFPKQTYLALPTALILLIYPVNYARTWLIIINNTYALLLALVAILMMVLYARTGKIPLLILGNALFLLSLGTYEAGLGIVIMSALLLIIFIKEIPTKRRLLIATFLITAIGFIIWRTWIQPQIFSIQDFYLESIDINAMTTIRRYIQGLFIFLFNWLGPLLIPFGEIKYWLFVGLSLFGAFLLIIFLPNFIKRAKTNPDFIFNERVGRIKSLLLIALWGGLIWFAGYIPVIFLYQPVFYGDASRVNFAAIPGASLALSAILAVLITVIVRKKEKINRLLFIAVIPLVLFAMGYQIHSQNIRNQIWEVNKNFWHNTFEVVPRLEDNTKVVIVIPGFVELKPFEMLPFRGDWEAESALRVLYNNPDLFAEYFYSDIPFHPDNWEPTEVDLSRYLFLYFDPNDSQVRIIEDPENALALPIRTEGYNPSERLKPPQINGEKYRGLVE